MSSEYLLALISFIGAFVFGWLTWVAKHVWQSKTKTQLFALIAIIFTIMFMIVGISMVPE